MENEMIMLKAEIYDANKAVNNLNGILSKIAQIVGIEEGENLDDLFAKLEEVFPSKE